MLLTASGADGVSLFAFDGSSAVAIPGEGVPTQAFSSGSVFAEYEGALYFGGRSDANGWGLYAYDPSVGRTAFVASSNPASSASVPSDFAVHNGKLFYVAENEARQERLYAYDATTNQATAVSSRSIQFARDLTVYDGALYLVFFDGSGDRLYRLNESETDLSLVAPNVQVGFNTSEVLGGDLYFTGVEAGENGLYRHNRAAGVVSRVVFLSNQGQPLSAPYLIAHEDKLFFSGSTEDGRFGFYSFDPVAETIARIPSATGSDGGLFGTPAVYGGDLYLGCSAQGGFELCAVDTDTESIEFVAELNRGNQSSSPIGLTEYDGDLYFFAGSLEGVGLFRHDPQSATSERVAAVDLPLFGSILPLEAAGYDGRLFFPAFDSATGAELYVYDPSSGAVSLVADLYPGEASSQPEEFTVYDDKLFFVASSGQFERELFAYDASTNQASKVADLREGDSGSFPEYLTVYQGKLYFSADAGAGSMGPSNTFGRELYAYDAATDQVTLAADVFPGFNAGTPTNLTVYGDDLYFQARGNLYAYDASSEEVAQLTSTFREGAGRSEQVVVYDDRLYFVARDSESTALWAYDDDTGETTRLNGSASGADFSAPTGMIVYAGKLFFHAENAASGVELFVYDSGTDAAEFITNPQTLGEVSPIGGLAVVGQSLYFSIQDDDAGRELWRYTDPRITSTAPELPASRR